MAINGIRSYPSTIQAMVASWSAANSRLAAAGLILPDGSSIETLRALNLQMEEHLRKVSRLGSDQNGLRGSAEFMREDIRDFIVLFNRTVRAVLADTIFVESLVKAPDSRTAPASLLKTANAVLAIWKDIDTAVIPGFTGPFLLRNGVNRAAFEDKVKQLTENFAKQDALELTLEKARNLRNLDQESAYAIMKKYREVVLARFEKTDSVVVNLPRLTPRPGSTPDAVEAWGEWDSALGVARLTWAASEEPHLLHYVVRWSSGSKYETSEDIILATITPDQPREFLTSHGLNTPQAVSVFKIYVVVKTGNERGSKTVRIERLE